MDFKTKKRELQRLKSWRHSKNTTKKTKVSSKLLSIAFEKLFHLHLALLVNKKKLFKFFTKRGMLLVQMIQILTVRLSLFRYVLLKYVKNIFFGMIFTEIFPIVRL